VDGPVSIGILNANGQGDVHLNLDSQAIGTINQAASLEWLDIHYQLADRDATSIGSGAANANVTTLNGFTAAHDSIVFNGAAATDASLAQAGSVGGTVADLAAALDARLDATHQYVFATYTGTGDINGDGASDQNAGVLAFDADGIGITAVLLTPGVTSMSAADLAV
jgi:hypothetical protein